MQRFFPHGSDRVGACRGRPGLLSGGSLTIAVMVITIGVAGSAQAERAGLVVYNNPNNVDLSPLNVRLDVLNLDRAWGFLFSNRSRVNASITDVYFERGFLDEALLDTDAEDRRIFETPGVDFTRTATPRLPLDDERTLNWRGNAFAFGANTTGGRAFENGVTSFNVDDFDPDDDSTFPEALLIAVDKTSFIPASRLVRELGRRGTRIAVQVEGVGGSDTGVFGGDVGLVTGPRHLVFGDDDFFAFFGDDDFDRVFGRFDATDFSGQPNIGGIDGEPNIGAFNRAEPDIGAFSRDARFDSGLRVGFSDGAVVGRSVVTGPLPAAVWPGLALLAGLAMKRRRRADRP